MRMTRSLVFVAISAALLGGAGGMVIGSASSSNSIAYSESRNDLWPPQDAALPFHDEWVELTAPRRALVQREESPPRVCAYAPEEAYAHQNMEIPDFRSRPRGGDTIMVQCIGNRCMIGRTNRF